MNGSNDFPFNNIKDCDNPYRCGFERENYEEIQTYKIAYNISVYLTLTCFCICFIVGVVGNGLVIWIAGLKMKTVSAVWFTNLAIVDFIFCISLPLRITQSFLQYTADSFIGGFVVINFITLSVNSTVSIAFLTIISIDRCVTVMWPLWAKIHRKRRTATICSVFVWIVSLTIGVIFSIFIGHAALHPGYFHFSFFNNIDNLKLRTGHYGPFNLNFLLSFVIFVIFLIIILVCYGMIILKLQSNTMKQRNRFKKTFRIIVAVVVCFFVGWFPYNVWPLIAKSETVPQFFASFIVSYVCLCLVSISSSINPILYVLMGRKGGNNSNKSIKARIENSLHG